MAKLIIGLGNPGDEYKNTRHNVGFKTIDSLAKKNNIELDKTQFNGVYGAFNLNGEKIILAKPMTYMNLSGQFVSKFVQYYNVDLNDLIIIHDDIDTNTGDLKLKTSGSSGGQNGVKNIIELLGTDKFKRIKIGIGPRNKQELVSYVLGKFSKDENEKIAKVINLIGDMMPYIADVDFSNLLAKVRK